MAKKINIAEIARLAGVSTAIVSYVINDLGKVSEKTKRKVQKIIAELNYIPSLNAKSSDYADYKLNHIDELITIIDRINTLSDKAI